MPPPRGAIAAHLLAGAMFRRRDGVGLEHGTAVHEFQPLAFKTDANPQFIHLIERPAVQSIGDCSGAVSVERGTMYSR